MNNVKQEDAVKPVPLNMVLEALTFAAETPVSVEQICKIYAEVVDQDSPPSQQAVEEALELLNESFEKEGRAVRIQNWAGGLRMATTASVAPFLETFFRRERARHLTKPLMETLSILAYKQPVTRVEIDAIRGVDSGYAIRKLLSLDLILIVGRADVVGRPILYATTDRFLDEFGLRDLAELPNLRQTEELLGDGTFDQQRLRRLISKGLDPEEPDGASSSSDTSSTN